MSVITAPPREGLIRSATDITLRSAGEGEPARLSGHFVVFDTFTEIASAWEGNFMERIAPGAARKTIRENGGNIKLLLEHGQDPTVGQKPLGRFTDLREDETGVFYDAELYDSDYVRELLPALRDGQYGASFRFRVIREEWNDNPDPSDDNPRGLPERTIKEMSIAEGGPVLWGAYPTATAQARSLTDAFLFRRLMDLPPEQIRELRELWETVERRQSITEDEVAERADLINELADEGIDPAEAVEIITETSTAPDEPEGESRREDEDAETPATEATSQRVNHKKARRSYLPPVKKEKKPWTLP
jgi:HK97 family phage prohead protease